MKSAGGRLLAALELDRDAAHPLHRQLYAQLRTQILTGALPSGTRLPSTRTLVAELGVSRITVVTAFEQLTAEGFLRSRAGDGTYVDTLWSDAAPQQPMPRPPLSERGAATSSRGTDLFSEAPHSWAPSETESFVASQVASSAFPAATWKRLLARHAGRTDPTLIGYSDPHGHPALREAIADYVNDVRGLGCTADQVVVTSGAQQAFNVLAVLLLDVGDPVIVEDPGHISGRLAFQSLGCPVRGVPVDEEGAVLPDELDEAGDDGVSPARLACLTPARQHPLGIAMSPARRAEWIAWAQRNGSWIVEDDCDSELRYRGKLLPTLFGLDLSRHVITVGSFSKVLAPSIRLGYCVLPEDLVEPFASASSVIGRPPAMVLQAALTDFLAEGHLHAHLRRTRRLYSARQDALLQAISQQLDHRIHAGPVDAGLHVIGWLRENADDIAVARGLAAGGVYTYPLGEYRLTRQLPPALLIGFAGTAEDHMPYAVGKMAAAWDRWERASAGS
ncbi:MocR-like pyridoxine biosynthesis transcription factor PdxR [Arthrobacter cupressi]|uniref:GntR family transcriptional regulator / MocR family aminotransferase n=1 Tax=Arthrobacter cupressi TaxID=1045773 RepID=A0A1G8VIH2_9MICC|nr:PLP-dependent aminotransferase family protein [Arthrobacter cupressi]NYD79464.1 GntR family transcriptional regulator/MocR family aminotransferase [Arthrobacter cupressi]SDJ65793.1 GntR family transcriptional regulator / MocR family aminotransferase [Arthrobacter cupressi]